MVAQNTSVFETKNASSVFFWLKLHASTEGFCTQSISSQPNLHPIPLFMEHLHGIGTCCRSPLSSNALILTCHVWFLRPNQKIITTCHHKRCFIILQRCCQTPSVRQNYIHTLYTNVYFFFGLKRATYFFILKLPAKNKHLPSSKLPPPLTEKQTEGKKSAICWVLPFFHRFFCRFPLISTVFSSTVHLGGFQQFLLAFQLHRLGGIFQQRLGEPKTKTNTWGRWSEVFSSVFFFWWWGGGGCCGGGGGGGGCGCCCCCCCFLALLGHWWRTAGCTVDDVFPGLLYFIKRFDHCFVFCWNNTTLCQIHISIKKNYLWNT